MDKDFWLNHVLNSLELVQLNPTDRGLRALKSMIRKYEKTFDDKLNITLPIVPNKYDKKYLSFTEFHSETNHSHNDSK